MLHLRVDFYHNGEADALKHIMPTIGERPPDDPDFPNCIPIVPETESVKSESSGGLKNYGYANTSNSWRDEPWIGNDCGNIGRNSFVSNVARIGGGIPAGVRRGRDRRPVRVLREMSV